MDRKYKAKDTVHVHQSKRGEGLITKFRQKPYSRGGYDNYKYNKVMYPSYIKDGYVYILLDYPLK